MTSARVDVVIVTYTTREDVLACLASIDAPRPAALGEIWLIDNASTDGTSSAVRRAWPDVRVVDLGTNAGFAAANNAGLRRSSATHVLLLNPDTRVGPGAIDTLLDRLASTGSVAAGPRLVDGEGRPEVSFGPMLTPAGELAQKLRVAAARRRDPVSTRYVGRLLAREREVDWVSGACLLVVRERAIEAGLLDERYFMYEEDVDFCAALRARGGRILFTPRAEIVHLRGRSIGAAPLRHAHYDRSHLAFYEKHAPAWAPILRLWLRVRGRSIR
jgi:GT2 family glycosyltransferase